MTDTTISLKDQLVAAHGHCHSNEREIASSVTCGCFHCLETFPPTLLVHWAELADSSRGGDTAICPKCGVDSVLGSASAYPLTADFLGAMHRRFFENIQ
jgi:hypothetical protein